MHEIVAFEQQGDPSDLSKRIREQIAEIQIRGMTATPAVGDKRGIGCLQKGEIWRHRLENRKPCQTVEQNDPALSLPAVDHDTRFDKRHGADQGFSRVSEDAPERLTFRFAQHDRNESRGIDGDHRGNPC